MSYFLTELLPVADKKTVTGSQKNCWLCKNRLLLFFSVSRSSNKPPFAFPSAQRTRRKVPPAFAMVSEKCMRSKDAFTLRVRRAENERKEKEIL